jgi:polyferredoxin
MRGTNPKDNPLRPPQKAFAVIRAITRGAVFALFLYAYLFPFISSNALLAFLVKTQFSAALYGGGVAAPVVVCIAAFTAVFGRLYCSALCPLGTLQEFVWKARNFLQKFFAKKGRGARKRSFGCKESRAARLAIPLITGAGIAFSVTPLMIALDPLSTFGRGMNAAGSFSLAALLLALPLILVIAAALFGGRAFCAWCPVGIALGVLSSFAPFKMRFQAGCTSCGACQKKCPARCIDSRQKRIDYGRCVVCFSCAASCAFLRYGAKGLARAAPSESGTPVTRRKFLKGTLSAACAAAYFFGADAKALFSMTDAESAARFILPPGAKEQKSYGAHCVGCYACAAVCPVGVIKASKALVPVLEYSRSSCQYDCVECGLVCPTGAIAQLSIEQKHTTRIALSSLDFELCVVNTKHESCGACAEVCPTHALRMIPYEEPGIPWLTKPVFEEAYCVGCGACLVACPARPNAFTILPVREQTATPGIRPSDQTEETFVYDPSADFPF